MRFAAVMNPQLAVRVISLGCSNSVVLGAKRALSYAIAPHPTTPPRSVMNWRRFIR